MTNEEAWKRNRGSCGAKQVHDGLSAREKNGHEGNDENTELKAVCPFSPISLRLVGDLVTGL